MPAYSKLCQRIGWYRHGSSAPMGAVGPHVCRIIAEVVVPVDVKRPDRSMQNARGVIGLVEFHKIPWENMCFDSTGQQGAIVDTIEREAGVLGRCIRVNSSDAVSERRIGPKGEIAKDWYKTRAAELVLQLCSLIQRQQICGLPKAVAYQLSTRGLIQEEGKADIEAKRDWMRANKGKSPNQLDAVAVMAEGLLQRKVLSLTQQWQPLAPESTLPEFMRQRPAVAGHWGRRRKIRNLVRRW